MVFLDAQQLSEEEEREKEFRSAESADYDDLYAGYTDAVEVPSVMHRVGQPVGPMLDAGCGTGRITKALGVIGQPILAIDYSDACLRRMLRRCEGIRVLAVQSDLRSIPVRSGACRPPRAWRCTSMYGTATARGSSPSSLAYRLRGRRSSSPPSTTT